GRLLRRPGAHQRPLRSRLRGTHFRGRAQRGVARAPRAAHRRGGGPLSRISTLGLLGLRRAGQQPDRGGHRWM
ncbi:MAG: hypothetical protein AVDCRST_MAG45-840, partial [uncultured Solirubrobacterales bacterium]